MHIYDKLSLLENESLTFWRLRKRTREKSKEKFNTSQSQHECLSEILIARQTGIIIELPNIGAKNDFAMRNAYTYIYMKKNESNCVAEKPFNVTPPK